VKTKQQRCLENHKENGACRSYLFFCGGAAGVNVTKEHWNICQSPPTRIKMNYGLGTRSKSQDAIRHRKNVRFANDTLGNSVEDLTSTGGRKSSRGRSFFLRSMLQSDQSSSSNGRLRGSKVSFFLPSCFSIKSHSHVRTTYSEFQIWYHTWREEGAFQTVIYLPNYNLLLLSKFS